MTATDTTTGLWGMMRQRWLDRAAQPREAHLRDDVGLPEIKGEPVLMPMLVMAWRR